MSSVSVIIPTHNRATLLQRALRSVLSQTRRADEILVIDDGSDDGTAEIVAKEFPEARCLRQENRGVSAARNAGVGEARGEWLAFLDSDDEWLPEKLARQLAALEASRKHRVCHTDEIWIRRGRRVNAMKKHAKQGGSIFKGCLPLCAISPSSVMIHRTLFEDVGLFDESLPVCEDYDLWLRITAVYPVLYLDEALIVKYGGHDDQLSRRYWGMDRYRIEALEKILRSGTLSEENRAAALATLLEKLDIYIGGARKRGKLEEAERWAKRRENYC